MRDNISNTWIIGASSGIGAALAQALAVEGGNLYLSARSSESLVKIKETINADGGRSNVECYPLDVVNLTEVSAAAEEIFQEAGRHRVIFMAALYDPMPIKGLDLEASDKIIDVNLKGLLNVLACVVPVLRQRTNCQIAICGSLASYRGLPNAQPYAATKAAVTNVAESLKVEEGELIDVKLINPGFVESRLTEKNEFKMPFLLSSEQAATYIVKGLSSRRFEVHFPKRFSYILKALRFLPDALYFRIARSLTS
tara:strand:+ start:104 stop:865 length:762 start_codon:yes stop_codon:yes gene_type:complete